MIQLFGIPGFGIHLLGWLAGVAHASSIGAGAGLGVDLGGDDATLGPVPSLWVPLRIDVSARAAIRATVSGGFTVGHDVVSWEIAAADRRVGEETRAIFASLGASVGPELRFPIGAFDLYAGASVGLALVHTWHSRMDHPDLFSVERYSDEELLDPLTINPYNRQLVPATDVAIGLTSGRLWGELGYGAQFLGRNTLIGSPEDLVVQREPFGWNAVRIVVGVAIPFGGER
ncbi:MAG: hypothetical protein ABMB14_05220 [Myxococcota bacterium]